ncbi:alpha/beta fold hydrolase [Blastomonas sp.]|uniref:alpha/beta fold hydrolase n=1 Tax=Blastomonas sp. TaxID=1909299 RepID=UPI003592F5BA
MPLFLAIARDELGDDNESMGLLLKALRRYQQADRSFMRPAGQILLQHGNAILRSAAGIDAVPDAAPSRIIFVPSPINAPYVLDMDADCSLMAWLHNHGLASGLVDWGRTETADRSDDIDSYAHHRLVPLLEALPGPVHLVGYCLGGLVAMAAACHVRVASLSLIASPWHFSGYPPARRAELATMWQTHRSTCAQLGLVPMEVMQQGFWTLSPAKLIQKYLTFGQMAADSPAARRFVAIEDWANGGDPLPFALGEQLFERLYGDDITGRGQWQVGGRDIHADAVLGPVMEFASATDDIVPLACSPDLPGRVVLGSGHVGMMVGSKAPDQLWPMLKDWILAHEPPKA